MMTYTPDQSQLTLFDPNLKSLLNNKNPLFILANMIDWGYFNKEFSDLYFKRGKPAMPIRFMVGCLLLQRIKNLSDEKLPIEWAENPYLQYFTGENLLQHKFKCDPSDFCHFRKRIGIKGVEKIFNYFITLTGVKKNVEVFLSDTTVQENYVTFPTEAKMAVKVIEKCNEIAENENIEQRQNYKKTYKKLLRNTHNGLHPKRVKNAKKALKKLKTISGRVLRELERKLPNEKYENYKPKLEMYKKIITQKKDDKDKIYSIHKPYTACIAKGKAHKKFEFGNKVGLVVDAKELVIYGIKSFEGNIHDSKTIAPLLQQMKDNSIKLPKEVVYDRGGRGVKEIMGVKISTPSKPKNSDTEYTKSKQRKKFRRRAAIEPVIGHLKKDFRMEQNYFSGVNSPTMNALLAATGWNIAIIIKKIIKDLFWPFFYLLFFIKKNEFRKNFA